MGLLHVRVKGCLKVRCAKLTELLLVEPGKNLEGCVILRPARIGQLTVMLGFPSEEHIFEGHIIPLVKRTP